MKSPSDAATPGPLRRSPLRARRRSPAFGLTPRAFWLLAAGLLLVARRGSTGERALLMIGWDAIVSRRCAHRHSPAAVRRPFAVTRRWGGATVARHDCHRVAGPPQSRRRSPIDLPARPTTSNLRFGRTRRRARSTSRRDDVERIVRAWRRGSAAMCSMGEALIEWRSSWGLVERWAHVAARSDLRVYPNLHEGRRHSMYLIRSRQIAIEKRRAGARRDGREFDSLRDYRPGDERRDVCWIVSARRWTPGHEGLSARAQPDRVAPRGCRPAPARTLRRSDTCSIVPRTAALTLAQVAMTSGRPRRPLAYGRRMQHRLAPARGAVQIARHRRGAGAHAVRGGRGRSRRRNGGAPDRAEAARPRRVADRRRRDSGRARRHRAGDAASRRAHVVLLATCGSRSSPRSPPCRPSSTMEMFRVLSAQEVVERRESLLRGLGQHGALVVEITPDALPVASSTGISRRRNAGWYDLGVDFSRRALV